MLPVSRDVSIPASHSPVLQTLIRSEQQSRAPYGSSNPLRSGDPRLELITQMLLQLIFNQRTPEQTQPALIRILGGLS